MEDFIAMVLRNVVRPASQRLATIIGSALTAQEVASDDVTTVLAAVPVVVGLAVDLVIRKLY